MNKICFARNFYYYDCMVSKYLIRILGICYWKKFIKPGTLIITFKTINNGTELSKVTSFEGLIAHFSSFYLRLSLFLHTFIFLVQFTRNSSSLLRIWDMRILVRVIKITLATVPQINIHMCETVMGRMIYVTLCIYHR